MSYVKKNRFEVFKNGKSNKIMINKETIRQFLKPKYLLAQVAIFFAILLISVFIGAKFGAVCVWTKSQVVCGCERGCGTTAYLFLPLWPTSLLVPCHCFFKHGLFIYVFDPSGVKLFLILISNFFYWSFLSYLIILIWNKIRTKK